jgi:type I restriction enzyme S subunit
MKFKEVQLQSVLDIQWGDTKTTKSSYVDKGYLAYSASGPDGFLEEYDYDCDAVVLSAIGANCGATFYASGKWSCIKNTIRILPKSDEIDLKYFYFMTKSPNFWPLRGSAQPFISQTDIRELVVSIPDLHTQEAIGELLFNFELAIQSKNLVSVTLEEIAQTVFKSWFVDFDPVKAKMVGDKPVGMDDATAALFPSSMEDSELGPIPAGWELHALSDIGEFRNGLAMQKFPVVDQEQVLPVIKIAQLRAGNTAGADLASGLIDPKFVVSDGDILFSWSGTLEIEHWAGGPGALNQHLFKVLGTSVPDWFIYFASRSHLPEFRRIAGGKATTMGHIQRGHLAEAKAALPPDEVFASVGELLRVLVSLKVGLLVQNRTLVKLRDSLFPRLISGELQIPEEMLAS